MTGGPSSNRPPYLSEVWTQPEPGPPMRYQVRLYWLVAAIVGLAWVAWDHGCGIASAAVSPTDAQALVLARVCAGEAGLAPSPDCPAIHAVLEDRARRMDVGYVTAARWYATRHLDRESGHGRRWVAWLRPDGRRPRGWPERASWDRWRGSWLALLAQAERVVDGAEGHSCEAQPHHFGDRHGDRRRALAMGWAELDCGDTRDSYWSVPALRKDTGHTGPSKE